jgi:hypothetical protein
VTAGQHMAAPFPEPSPIISGILDELRAAVVSPPETDLELRELAVLPRPWDPPSCGPDLRRLVYTWLDDVVAWVNTDHAWRPDRLIPGCWQDHPHIVHELATIACLRWEAALAVTPVPLEDWHRYALPTFLDRIAQRIGTTGCPPGKHMAPPANTRNTNYHEQQATSARRRRRNADSG